MSVCVCVFVCALSRVAVGGAGFHWNRRLTSLCVSDDQRINCVRTQYEMYLYCSFGELENMLVDVCMFVGPAESNVAP